MPFLSPATRAPPSSSSSMSSGSPSFDLGSGNGSLWCDFSSDSSIGNPAKQHNWVVREGWIRALVQLPWVNSMIPLSMTWPTLNLMP